MLKCLKRLAASQLSCRKVAMELGLPAGIPASLRKQVQSLHRLQLSSGLLGSKQGQAWSAKEGLDFELIQVSEASALWHMTGSAAALFLIRNTSSRSIQRLNPCPPTDCCHSLLMFMFNCICQAGQPILTTVSTSAFAALQVRSCIILCDLH